MTGPEAIGTAGVTLLLLAFVGNLTGRLGRDAWPYQALNAAGAALACASAVGIRFWPFVVLEGVWAAVAVVALLRGPGARRG